MVNGQWLMGGRRRALEASTINHRSLAMFSLTNLDSGLRIVTEKMPTAQSVAVGVWVCAGSAGDPEEHAGLSHFIEHMLFKGTETRTAAEIAETIDSVGGFLDAFTDREHVCYYAKVLREHAPVAIELLGDMVTHPRLEPSDIEVEKGVILEEIFSCADSPEEMVMDRFTETIWETSPLGRNVLGTVDSVQQLDRKAIQEGMRETYVPGRVVVSVAGNIEHEEVVAWVESGLRDLPDAREALGPSSTTTPDLTPVVQSNQLLVDKDTERVYFCVGAPSYGQKSPERFTAHLIDMVLSGGCSSRLFQEIREKRGLVYSIGSTSACCRDAGFLGVSASCGVENVATVAELIGAELRSLKRHGVTAVELERAKQQARGNLLLATESTSERMIRNAQNLIYFGRMVPIDDVLNKVAAITVEDTGRVADQIFDDAFLNLVGVGPFKERKVSFRITVG